MTGIVQKGTFIVNTKLVKFTESIVGIAQNSPYIASAEPMKSAEGMASMVQKGIYIASAEPVKSAESTIGMVQNGSISNAQPQSCENVVQSIEVGSSTHRLVRNKKENGKRRRWRCIWCRFHRKEKDTRKVPQTSFICSICEQGLCKGSCFEQYHVRS